MCDKDFYVSPLSSLYGTEMTEEEKKNHNSDADRWMDIAHGHEFENHYLKKELNDYKELTANIIAKLNKLDFDDDEVVNTKDVVQGFLTEYISIMSKWNKQ